MAQLNVFTASELGDLDSWDDFYGMGMETALSRIKADGKVENVECGCAMHFDNLIFEKEYVGSSFNKLIDIYSARHLFGSADVEWSADPISQVKGRSSSGHKVELGS